MENYQSSSQQVVTKPARPVFLTVLCILTFIGSGWAIVSGISSYLTADTTADIVQAAMEDAKDKIDDAGGGSSKMAEKMISGASEMVRPENLKKSAMFSIIAAVCTLGGAIFMFMLKKAGYWLYILGTAISIAGPLYIFGGNLISMLSTVLIGIVGIVFVILYGLNLKYLR
jgi:1,4-dihydroxy-2-naphthoate octaprenyltransferase